MRSGFSQSAAFCEQTKDTVATDEQNDEVHADDDAEGPDTAVRLNTVVHHHVPIFTGQYLHTAPSST